MLTSQKGLDWMDSSDIPLQYFFYIKYNLTKLLKSPYLYFNAFLKMNNLVENSFPINGIIMINMRSNRL